MPKITIDLTDAENTIIESRLGAQTIEGWIKARASEYGVDERNREWNRKTPAEKEVLIP